MKKFNFRKVLDGLTASSPSSGSSSGSNSGGAGSGSMHPGGTAGVLREEIQETLTSEYFQICKVSFENGLRTNYFLILLL
jgi:syntaxin-binding protein 5